MIPHETAISRKARPAMIKTICFKEKDFFRFFLVLRGLRGADLVDLLVVELRPLDVDALPPDDFLTIRLFPEFP